MKNWDVGEVGTTGRFFKRVMRRKMRLADGLEGFDNAGMKHGRPPRWFYLLVLGTTLAVLTGCASNRWGRAAGASGDGERGTLLTEAELRSLANDAYTAQDWPLAETRYGELTRRTPDDGESWLRLGNIYARTERTDLAMKAYQEAVAREADDPRAWHNLGVLQMRAALATFKRMQNSVPKEEPLRTRMDELASGLEGLLAQPADAPGSEPLDLRTPP